MDAFKKSFSLQQKLFLFFSPQQKALFVFFSSAKALFVFFSSTKALFVFFSSAKSSFRFFFLSKKLFSFFSLQKKALFVFYLKFSVQENVLTRWYKPLFYKHVQSFLARGRDYEYIPLQDYLLRHNRGIFWVLETMIPFCNNPVFRLVNHNPVFR